MPMILKIGTMKFVNKKALNFVLVVVIFCVAFYLFSLPDKHDIDQDRTICKTVGMSVAGKITGFGGHGIYQWIQVDNIDQGFYIQVDETKFVKGLAESYVDYEVGDSLIKKAGSKEFMIKRDTCMAVYVLSCRGL
jgi:hypothetical protein